MENSTVNNVGSATLMNIIISAIPSGVEDVSMLDVDNAITTNTSSGPKFTLGLTATSDLYQAMLYCSNKYKIAPPLGTPRKPDFYSAFNLNGKGYFTLLRIPEFSIQGNYSPSVHGPIIFIPKDVLGRNTFSGYSWNTLTNSLNSITLNDDDVEDHIDNSTAYIVVVDFDEVSSTGGGRNASNCEGGWDCTDSYCDSACGELPGCQDCNNLYDKRLILEKIRINDDERTTKGGTVYVIDKHFVSALGGRYKLGLNTVVLHGNGKFEAINNGRIDQKWKKSQVKRVIHRKSGPKSKGTATWKTVNLKDEPGDGILLSNHFNMTAAKIYINIYELDFLFGGKHDFFAPAYNSVGIPNAQYWRSNTMPALTGPGKGYYYSDISLNPAIFDLSDVAAEVLPAAWANVAPAGGVRELEITRANVTFILKVIDK